MAPVKPKSTKGSSSKKSAKPSGSSAASKVKKRTAKPAAVQQKSKPVTGPPKKKKRIYTEKELGIPQLNMITPVGVQKPQGKKKGKIFVDDKVSLMVIGHMRFTCSFGGAGKHDDHSRHG